MLVWQAYAADPPTRQSECFQTRLSWYFTSTALMMFSISQNSRSEKKPCPDYWPTRADLRITTAIKN
jgi:hypothetical protein